MTERVVRHNVNWNIRPSHLAAVLAGAYLLWRFGVPILSNVAPERSDRAENQDYAGVDAVPVNFE